jgi:hypothetical protein
MQIEFATRRATSRKEDGSEVFEWFEKYVLHSKLDVSIDHLELVSFNQLLSISVSPVKNSILILYRIAHYPEALQ